MNVHELSAAATPDHPRFLYAPRTEADLREHAMMPEELHPLQVYPVERPGRAGCGGAVADRRGAVLCPRLRQDAASNAGELEALGCIQG